MTKSAVILLMVLLGLPFAVTAQTAQGLQRKAEETLEIWQEIQRMERGWAEERERLLRRVDDLELKRRHLLWRKRKLQAYIASLKADISELKRRLEEMRRIDRELEPYLDETWQSRPTFRAIPFMVPLFFFVLER